MKAQRKMITCIVPAGTARSAIKALYEQFGITTAQFNFARGIGKRSPLSERGWGEESEKEILNVIVQSKQADEVFEFLFYETQIDQPHRGIIYMQSLIGATEYRLPEMLEPVDKHH